MSLTIEQPRRAPVGSTVVPSDIEIERANSLLNGVSRIAFALAPLTAETGGTADHAATVVDDLDQLMRDYRRSMFDDAVSTPDLFDHVVRVLCTVVGQLEVEWVAASSTQRRSTEATRLLAAADLARITILHFAVDPSPSERPCPTADIAPLIAAN